MKLPNFKLYQTALQNLEAARKLILPKKRWITDALARDKNGADCGVKSEAAEAFCALGAVKRINGPGEKKAIEILRKAAKEIIQNKRAKGLEDAPLSVFPRNQSIFQVNDDYGRKDTLAMFRRAIALAKEK
jgi:hypothetical protein